MQISTHFRYGLRVLVELASSGNSKPLSLKLISERQELPVKFIEHLVSKLKSAGIVQSYRGKFGGYLLARSPEDITLLDVFIALEPRQKILKCLSKPGECIRRNGCLTYPVWEGLQEVITQYLNNINVAELIERS